MPMAVNRSEDLKADEDGYYPVVLSFLGTPNQNGLVLGPLDAEQVDALHRRTLEGTLGQRMETVHEKLTPEIPVVEVSHVIKGIYVDSLPNEIGGSRQVVRGKIQTTMTPYGKRLQAMINSPGNQLSFGLRAFTTIKEIDGVKTAQIHDILSWDLIDVLPEHAEVVDPNLPR